MLSPAHEERIREELGVLERARGLLRQPGLLCDGRARIQSADGRETELLLGTSSRPRTGLALIDWRTAPLAEVFFGFREGEDYTVEVAGRPLEGRLLRRSLLAFEGGELVEIAVPGALLSRRGGGAWRTLSAPTGPTLASDDRPVRRWRSPVEVDLDPAQRRLVELPPRRPVLLLGEAGSGKTVVALHRLAHLHALANGRLKAAVIVPVEGLRAWTASMVERLGMPEIDVWLYDRFAAAQGRRRFPDVPRKESQNASGGVIRLKRHAALRLALAEMAERSPAPPEEGRPRRRTKALARWDDLHHMFGDRALLERVAGRSGGGITAGMIRDVREHTRVQFSTPAEVEFAHVSPGAQLALDGRPLDEGTPMEDAGTVDVEDYAVLFELDRMRAERQSLRASPPRTYDCIVLDEAQELAPLELALVGRSLRPRGTLIVAGDADQQVEPTSSFPGWPAVMRELGAPEHETGMLEVSYRCPPEVTAWARRLRAGAPRWDGPPMAGQGMALVRFRSECHLLDWLVEALARAQERDPGCSVAVICRTPETAALFGRALNFGLAVHLALEGRFIFGPGIQVTCVEEVKGLEFDTVVIPDATATAYPDGAEARRALYVGATRTARRLVLAAAGRPTPLAGEFGI